MSKDCNNSLGNLCSGLYKSLLVEKPCKIINVHSQYIVDIEYYDNNKADMLYQVPVKHHQTNRGYIFLGLRAGDCGTVRFFDNDVSEYIYGEDTESILSRKHDINDNIFTYGFYPSSLQYVFPQGDVVIGTTTGAVINLSGGSIVINGGNIVLSGNTTIDGKVFLEHTHENGNNGSPTGKVI